MSIAPLNEVIVSFTNAVLKSPYGQSVFPPTPEGESNFDSWQSTLLDSALLIHDYWNEDGSTTEDAIDLFEETLALIFPSTVNSI